MAKSEERIATVISEIFTVSNPGGAVLGCSLPGMQHARSTLSKIYANAVQRAAGEQAPVIVWPLVCGSKVAQRTAALSYLNGELAVRVPDGLWRNQLECLTGRYLAALNQVSREKVKSIRFVAPD